MKLVLILFFISTSYISIVAQNSCDLELNLNSHKKIDEIVTQLIPVTIKSGVIMNINSKKFTIGDSMRNKITFSDIPVGNYSLILSDGQNEFNLAKFYHFCKSDDDYINLQLLNSKITISDRRRNMARPTDDFFRVDPNPPKPPSPPQLKFVEALNGKAIRLPKPVYPAVARAVDADGEVAVEVVIDEVGNVISAKAISGHSLLQKASEKAALEAKFEPTLYKGKPVRVTGVIYYTFIP